MPVVELASASLQDTEYDKGAERDAPGLGSGGSSSDFSSTKGRMGLGTDYITTPHQHDARSTKSTDGNQSIVKSAFTNFTESLSHSSEEFQDGVQKTFSSIVSSFSRDNGSTSDSGYGEDSGASSSRWSGDSSNSSRSGVKNLRWSEFVLPEGLRSRVSSLTSRSSSYQTNTTSSSLSSRSTSPRMNSDNIAITVDSAGFVLRESSEESSGTGEGGSEASWQETASRDVSLLDTIGESEGEDEDSSSSSSGSDSGSEVDEEGQEVEHKGGEEGLLYDYDDDSTEFNSDVGLEDLGAVMLQIGSCHFEPESVSQSFDDDYSYSSEMFPPIIKSFIGQSKENGGDVANDIQSEAGRSAILHQRRLNHINRQNPDQQNQQKGISNFFNKAFSCGGQM